MDQKRPCPNSKTKKIKQYLFPNDRRHWLCEDCYNQYIEKHPNPIPQEKDKEKLVTPPEGTICEGPGFRIAP